MSRFAFQPMKPLRWAWKRFRARRGKQLTSVAGEAAKPLRAVKAHHRHTAFLRFP